MSSARGFVLALCLLGSGVWAVGPTLSNDILTIAFGETGGFPVTQLGLLGSGKNVVVSSATEPLWTLVAVDAASSFSVDARQGTQSYAVRGDELVLSWQAVPLRKWSTINVTITCTLPQGQSFASWSVSVLHSNPSAPVSVWQLSLAVSGLTAEDDDTLFYPTGYGVEIPARSRDANQNSLYPSSGATMQFLAVGGGQRSGGQGAYFAVHDAQGAMKNMRTAHVAVTAQTGSPATEASFSPSRFLESIRSLGFGARSGEAVFAPPVHVREGVSAGPSTVLATDILLPGAGLPFTAINLPYTIAVGVTARTPTWFAAASLYRGWALENAAWLSAGPVSKRADLPRWFLETNLWVNSGWQCHDIFNETQGDPKV
jgi:hypothetical protein